MSRNLFRRIHSSCRAIRPNRAKRGLPPIRVQLNGAAAGGDGLSQIVFTGFKPHVQERAAIRHAGIRARVPRIDGYGACKHLAGEFEALAPQLIKELPAAEVIIVSLHLAGGHLLDFSFFFFGEHDAQGARDVLRDLIRLTG